MPSGKKEKAGTGYVGLSNSTHIMKEKKEVGQIDIKRNNFF